MSARSHVCDGECINHDFVVELKRAVTRRTSQHWLHRQCEKIMPTKLSQTTTATEKSHLNVLSHVEKLSEICSLQKGEFPGDKSSQREQTFTQSKHYTTNQLR